MQKIGTPGLGWSHGVPAWKGALAMDVAELGATLRARRKTLHLTQSETADLADISTRVLSDLENGRETVRLDILTAVATALGMSLSLNVTLT